MTDIERCEGCNKIFCECRDIGPCGRCDGQGVIYDLTRLASRCPGCKGTGRLTTTIPEHNPWID